MAKKKLFVTNGDESVHLHSENGTAYELAVGNDGALTVTNEATGAVSGGGGSGLPTGGAAHQMLVTDAEGKALWEDRTHYAYTGLVEVLPETTVEIDPDSMEGVIAEPLAGNLVAGGEYTVTYNGVEYVCKAQELSVNGWALVCLGNVGALTGEEGTGEPFAFAALPPELTAEGGDYAVVYAFDVSANVTIKISGVGETVHRLDRKYLPEYIYGDEVKDVTFLSETTLERVPAGDGMNAYFLTVPLNIPFVMNAVYTAVFNGVEYPCSHREETTSGDARIVISASGVFSIDPQINTDGDTPVYGLVYTNESFDSITISITGVVTTVHQVPEKYLPEVKNTNIVNGSALGSLRSVNALAEGVGGYSMGSSAVALGDLAKASISGAMALGSNAVASGIYSFAAGGYSVADGMYAFAGPSADATDYGAAALGLSAAAKAFGAVALGCACVAASKRQCVAGYGNIEDASGRYVHIIGNGSITGDDANTLVRSNAHTLDWDGNAWYQGYVEGTKLILPSPNGTRWAITVGDDGTLSAAAVTE